MYRSKANCQIAETSTTQSTRRRSSCAVNLIGFSVKIYQFHLKLLPSGVFKSESSQNLPINVRQ